MRRVLGGMAAAAAVGLAGAAEAAPVLWDVADGGNGHWYEFVAAGVGWQAAFDAAGASTFASPGGVLTGYLATITSAEENRFLISLAPNGWFGGSDQEQEGVWKWMAGPEAGQVFWNGGPGGSAPAGMFASWGGGEPNDSNGEDYGHTNSGTWNDYPGSVGLGYYVEYSAAPGGGGVGGVPEPGAWALMILGFGAAGAVMRGRRRSLAVAG
jgi:hypothetical protein